MRGENGLIGLDELRVGMAFDSERLIVEKDEVVNFGHRFDRQPFHLGEADARNTIFGGLIASGWHTAAMTMWLLVEGGLPLRGGIIGLSAEVGWVVPVRPGDELRTTTEVTQIAPSMTKPDQAVVTTSVRTLNQHDTVVQHAVMRILASREPPVPGPKGTPQ